MEPIRAPEPRPVETPGARRFLPAFAVSSAVHGGLLVVVFAAGGWGDQRARGRATEVRAAHPLVVRSTVPWLESPAETLAAAEPTPALAEPLLVEALLVPPGSRDERELVDPFDTHPSLLRFSTREALALLPAAQDPVPSPEASAEQADRADPQPPIVPEDVGTAPVVVEPVLIAASAPRYPRLSVRVGEEGTVLCRLRVALDGSVTSVEVARSSGFSRLDAAATRALLTWRFEPKSEGGVARPAEILHPVTFVLDVR